MFRTLTLVLAAVIVGVSYGAAAHVSLDDPVGGLNLVKGQTYTIQWDAYLYHGPGTIMLEFSSNDGVDYTLIVSGIVLASAEEVVGTYVWTVPDVDSSACKVKVTYAAGAKAIYTGASNAFTIGALVGGGGGEGLPALKDNTLYESPTGARSNGAGGDLFVGRTGTNAGIGDLKDLRRAVMEFDISGNVPASAIINEVTLTLKVTREANVGAQDSLTKLHRLTSDWGEGSSNASSPAGEGAASTTGDATWIHTFYSGSTWATAGGDYSGTVSASENLTTDNAFFDWGSTAQMVADVQSWLDTPSSNFGWILIGDESTSKTAKEIASSENVTTTDRPSLVIDYTAAGSLDTVYVDFDASHPEAGSVSKPYNTFEEGITAVSSGASSVINLDGSATDLESSWTGTIDKNVKLALSPVGSPVRIGVSGEGSKSRDATGTGVAALRAGLPGVSVTNGGGAWVPEAIVAFSVGDGAGRGTGGSEPLSFEAARGVLAGLTRAEFAAYDLNGDGVLSQEELDAAVAKKADHENGGCFSGGKSLGVLTDLKAFFGDLFLLGLLSVVLVAWRGFGVRP